MNIARAEINDLTAVVAIVSGALSHTDSRPTLAVRGIGCGSFSRCSFLIKVLFAVVRANANS